MRGGSIIKKAIIGIPLTALVLILLLNGCQKTTNDAARMYESNKAGFHDIVALMRAHPELSRVDDYPEAYDYPSLTPNFHHDHPEKYSSEEREFEALRPAYLQISQRVKSIHVDNVQVLTDKGMLTVYFSIDGPGGLLDRGDRLGAIGIYYDEDPRGLHIGKRSTGEPACRPLPDRFWYVCREDLF